MSYISVQNRSVRNNCERREILCAWDILSHMNMNNNNRFVSWLSEESIDFSFILWSNYIVWTHFILYFGCRPVNTINKNDITDAGRFIVRTECIWITRTPSLARKKFSKTRKVKMYFFDFAFLVAFSVERISFSMLKFNQVQICSKLRRAYVKMWAT